MLSAAIVADIIAADRQPWTSAGAAGADARPARRIIESRSWPGQRSTRPREPGEQVLARGRARRASRPLAWIYVAPAGSRAVASGCGPTRSDDTGGARTTDVARRRACRPATDRRPAVDAGATVPVRRDPRDRDRRPVGARLSCRIVTRPRSASRSRRVAPRWRRRAARGTAAARHDGDAAPPPDGGGSAWRWPTVRSSRVARPGCGSRSCRQPTWASPIHVPSRLRGAVHLRDAGAARTEGGDRCYRRDMPIPRRYTTDAIVLSRFDLGEADRS